MLEKIKNYQNKIPIDDLRDVRSWGQIIFVIIALLVFWSGAKSIQTNYDLQKQISTLKQQNSISKLKNNNLQLQNSYYNTKQFLDISARQELGLGLPGETELLIPKNVALAHLAPLSTSQSVPTDQSSNSHQPWYEKNFQSWIDFFLHRHQPAN